MKHKKRLVSFVAAVVMSCNGAVMCLPASATASALAAPDVPVSAAVAQAKAVTTAENGLSGTCGEKSSEISWSLNPQTGLLSFSGTGSIRDFYGLGAETPWRRKDIIDKVQEIVIGDGITGIPKQAFYKMPNLRAVSLPETLTFIRINNGQFPKVTLFR